MSSQLEVPIPPLIPHSGNFMDIRSMVTVSDVNIFDTIDMNGNRIIDLAAPISNNDAATKQYVDDAASGGATIVAGPILATAGTSSINPLNQSGTGNVFLTSENPVITLGNLDMDTGRIVDLGAPINPTDAATKDYVDSNVMADLTGPITSVGNVTSIAAQTGTGTTFVVQTSPTLITPDIGVATGTSLEVGSVEVTNDVTVGGQIISTNLTDSSGLLTGSIYTPGGLSVSKNVNIGLTCYADEFLATSDLRYKRDVKQIGEEDLKRFGQVKGYTYYLKNDPRRKYGVVAQELEEVGLERLVEETDGFKRVSYGAIIPLLIETLRRTNVDMEKLKEENENMRTRVDMLENVLVRHMKKEEMRKFSKSGNAKSAFL